MKIAVTYEKGLVFPHFGKTKEFKIYQIENGKIQSARIFNTNGTGHEALADLLAGEGVEILICGGIGEGAKNALAGAGVDLCSGAEGPADDAVERFLAGELTSSGVNCDHHHHEEAEAEKDAFPEEEYPEEDFEEHGCGGCGGGCGGCSGGCHPVIEGPNVGKTVKTHYRGTFNDGTEFDSSYNRGEPLEFVCGAGMMIPGFDKAVAVMEKGQKITVHLMPEDAYGMSDPNAVFTMDVKDMPGSEELKKGQRVYLSNIYGQQFPATVTEREGDSITFDANHEMAGKELNFEIELIDVIG